ncbi:hypothetical protein R3D73_005497, partial [Serratia marcescens]|nr:hypothetical protein [Serratia marcescens]ELQ9442571.1 hypothetical protein [Serratia marcescens]ELT5563323.1 hypothetical protein [Serratia marcescens]
MTTPIYTSQPAPANANPVAWEMRYWNSGHNMWHDWERITAEQHAEMSVLHAADNDYEFRVLYASTPPPAMDCEDCGDNPRVACGTCQPLYAPEPAVPAVPGIDELRLTFERAERESDDGFNLHKYGIGYADEATQARWESWLACRAAMLNHVGEANEKAAEKCECSSIDYCGNCLRGMMAQPVSQRYTFNSQEIPDGWKLVPVEPTEDMIAAAMNCDDVEFNSDETFCVNFDN